MTTLGDDATVPQISVCLKQIGVGRGLNAVHTRRIRDVTRSQMSRECRGMSRECHRNVARCREMSPDVTQMSRECHRNVARCREMSPDVAQMSRDVAGMSRECRGMSPDVTLHQHSVTLRSTRRHVDTISLAWGVPSTLCRQQRTEAHTSREASFRHFLAENNVSNSTYVPLFRPPY